MAYNFVRASQQALTTTFNVTSVPLTIAAWFKTSTTSTQMGIARAGSPTAQSISQALLMLSDGSIAASSRAPISNIYSTAGSSLNNGAWQHGAAVFSATNIRRAWANGLSGNVNSSNVAETTLASTSIGSRFQSFVDNFDGDIAEVGMWDVALFADEIRQLAEGMSCDKVRPQSLVFYAPLVRDLIDATGGQPLTNTNGATVANHPRVYA